MKEPYVMIVWKSEPLIRKIALDHFFEEVEELKTDQRGGERERQRETERETETQREGGGGGGGERERDRQRKESEKGRQTCGERSESTIVEQGDSTFAQSKVCP